jgi:hypothetical protein
MGHAFMQYYEKSFIFRLRAWMHYYTALYWIVFASAFGSLIATYIASFF